MTKTQYAGHIYSIKDNDWLESQRWAGKVLAGAVKAALEAISPGKSTADINQICEEYILSHDSCLPTFKGYRGFPAASCISINEEVVHGIPRLDKIIQEGDVVKFDAGVTYHGAIADMARTIIVGQAKEIRHKLLMEHCSLALDAAIASFKFTKGHLNRLGNIGNAISKEAKKINAKAIIDLGGHGLEPNKLHGLPFVSNVGEKDDGPIIYAGTTLAIEPMLTYGDTKFVIEKDGWTVTLPEIATHFEDTIFVHDDRVEILTR